MQAGGLDASVCFGTRQAAHVLHGGLGREEPLRTERVRPVDHTRCGDRCCFDRPTEFLHPLQPHPQLHGVELRRIDLRHGGQGRCCSRCGVVCPIGRRFGLDRGDETQPDRLETIDTPKIATPRSPPPPAISSTPTELMLPIMTKGSHTVARASPSFRCRANRTSDRSAVRTDRRRRGSAERCTRPRRRQRGRAPSGRTRWGRCGV